jgi:glutamine cyclotransferase
VDRSFKLFIAGFLVLLTLVLVMFHLYSKDRDAPANWTYQVVNTFPHDPQAFTQGLVFENGVLYEGTGLPIYSELRKVELETGNVLQTFKLPAEFFGEGITICGDKIIQLTYQSNVGFVYDKDSFELLQEFNYPTEGWGITHDGEHLIMSDGTPMLYWLDPKTFAQVRKIMVCERDVLIWGLNELEYIEGQVYANVWPSERIVRIDPETGQVVGWIDMTGLLSPQEHTDPDDVLNGIAYDPTSKHLFVTGKYWPKLFEIKLIPKK